MADNQHTPTTYTKEGVQTTPLMTPMTTPGVGAGLPGMPTTPAVGQVGGSTTTSTTNNPNPKSKIKIKTALAILGIIAFLLVASVGVFIAQRQQQVSEPVAPNAPVSTPSAAGGDNSCLLEFSVAPPDGVANCESKKAFTVSPELKDSKVIANNELLPRGTEFFYQIKVSASKLTSGNVDFSDQLPEALTFVNDPANTAGLTYDETTKTLTKSLGQMQPNQVIKINFKVKLLDDAELGSFSNSASIATAGSGQQEPVQCTSILGVEPEGKAVCDAKTAYTLGENGEIGKEIPAGSSVNPGEKLVYRIAVSTKEPTMGGVVVVDTLPSKVKFVEAITEGLTHEDGVVRAETNEFKYHETKDDDGGSPEATPSAQVVKVYYDFIVQVDASASAGVLTNNVSVANEGDGDGSDASSCSLELVIPENKCNDACTVDAQCPKDLACVDSVCRLPENPTDTQCKPKSAPKPTPTPTPPPVIGCNDDCGVDSDCSNANHICYNTDAGGKCRLASNVESLTCTNPTTSAPVITPPPTQQPELPPELPQTGWTELGNWLKAGLVTIGVGVGLLLLL